MNISAHAPVAGQRVNIHGRVEAALSAVLPSPRTPGATVGFTVEDLEHGMAQLRDPQGRPCGVFASKQIAPRTLNFLNR